VSRLPELLQRQAIKLLNQFCNDMSAHQFDPHQSEYRIEGQQINLFELRQSACAAEREQKLPIAQLRYNTILNQWTLHHQNGQHWQLYLQANPTLELGKLLEAIKQDPFGHFWSK
jgi:hypothetical protein